jgi:hypothetical protein
MVMKANAKNLTGSTTTKTLVVGAMIVAVIAASLLAPSRAPPRIGERTGEAVRDTDGTNGVSSKRLTGHSEGERR